jgi:hypothetical protein
MLDAGSKIYNSDFAMFIVTVSHRTFPANLGICQVNFPLCPVKLIASNAFVILSELFQWLSVSTDFDKKAMHCRGL